MSGQGPSAAAKALARTWLAAVLVLACGLAQAHLMSAQRGTLNIANDAAWLVLSVPASALPMADDDRDGRISLAELRRHAPAIETALRDAVSLANDEVVIAAEGVMLNLTPPAQSPGAPAAQLVMLARYPLAMATADRPPALSLRIGLYGTRSDEQDYTVFVTRGGEQQLVRFSPDAPLRDLLPSPARAFAGYFASGVQHILQGLDHLLFILVVLASGAGWRHAVLALSCFTIGHAITLVAAALGHWSVPARLVEPAIAVTLIGMAAWDAWLRHRGDAPRPGLRLALVFGCALIHGLGLAGSLEELGLDGPQRLWGLAGFNLGVEAGQLAVAALAALGAWSMAQWRGPQVRLMLTRLAGISAVCAGSFWLLQRVGVLA